MIIISAMSQDRIIGKGDGLPWSVPEEYNQFLDFIRGQTVVLGRKSYPVFGKSLTSDHNVVVSRSIRELPGAVVVPTIEEAVELATSYGKTVFSAGGSTIYEQTIPLADAMYLSFMKAAYAPLKVYDRNASKRLSRCSGKNTVPSLVRRDTVA